MPAKHTVKRRIRRSEAFVGIHFDFHANKNCKIVGKTLTRKMLRDMLLTVKPDYVQCDCKGHPGLASYPTKVGTPAPGFVRDPLKLWREVTGSRSVAVSLMRNEDSLFVHFNNLAGGRDANCTTFDEIPATGPLELRLRLPQSPSAIFLRPSGRRLKWHAEGDQVMLRVPRVAIHDIVEILAATP